jgi:hypothetical protein
VCSRIRESSAALQDNLLEDSRLLPELSARPVMKITVTTWVVDLLARRTKYHVISLPDSLERRLVVRRRSTSSNCQSRMN